MHYEQYRTQEFQCMYFKLLQNTFVQKTIAKNLQIIIHKLNYWNISFSPLFELLTRSRKNDKYRMITSFPYSFKKTRLSNSVLYSESSKAKSKENILLIFLVVISFPNLTYSLFASRKKCSNA